MEACHREERSRRQSARSWSDNTVVDELPESGILIQSPSQLRRKSLQGKALSARLATLFAVVVIIADLFIRYPKDLDVPALAALLVYPAVGFVAEVVFRLLL